MILYAKDKYGKVFSKGIDIEQAILNIELSVRDCPANPIEYWIYKDIRFDRTEDLIAFYYNNGIAR